MNFIQKNYTKYVSWVIVFFISMVMLKLLFWLHVYNTNALCSAAKGVVLGQPHWLAYQNRLLGPYTVEFISQLLPLNYCAALNLFNLITLIIEYFVLYLSLLKYSKYNYSLSITYVIYFSFMLLGIQHYWSYTWDAIDVIIFTLFAYFIFSKKSIGYFIILFLIEILNRESALFIALFIIIDAFSVNTSLRTIKTIAVDKVKVIVGLLLLISGMIYTKFIRELLFVKSSLKGVGADLEHQITGNHFKLPINIEQFLLNFTNMNFINSVFIIFMLLYLYLNFKKFDVVQIKALILFIGLLVSIIMFGVINETRMFTILLPFLIFFHLSLREEYKV